MCASGLVAARVQVLVCEPIPDVWVDWMDSLLVNCGGKPWPLDRPETAPLKDRPSPVQLVVVGSSKTTDACHDLKSGFMEAKQQELIFNPSSKDLVSSDKHDAFVAFKWSSLITVRAVNAFLQASADIAAAASSPEPQTVGDGPSSPFLIPSFVRVSYVSEENNKVAKWRMHGDFFHPAAWEISKDSFDMTWIPHSLSGAGGIHGLCYDATAAPRKLGSGCECGQWWLYMTKLQMPISPDVYASEQTPPPVQGGSNFYLDVD